MPAEKDVHIVSSRDVSTAILRVCKLFNHEAAPILYGKTTFRVFFRDISGQEIFKNFTRRLAPSSIRAIASIDVELEDAYHTDLFVKDSKLDLPPRSSTCTLNCCLG